MVYEGDTTRDLTHRIFRDKLGVLLEPSTYDGDCDQVYTFLVLRLSTKYKKQADKTNEE